jgi:hypothetical protein
MSLVVVYLASPRASGWLRWSRLDCLCASVSLLKRFAPPLPVVVFHEDYNEEDKARLQAILPEIKFEQVDFSGHENEHASHRPQERVGSYGYAMMCRFFSGIMQVHPAITGYTHYMRLDDDSYIVANVSEGTLKRMQGHDYSYNSSFADPHPAQVEFTKKFMAERHLFCQYGDKYWGESPYTNYHAASLKLWQHPVIQEFVIAQQEGCLKHGWNDASVAAMLVFFLCPALGLTVNYEPDFPYRHNIQCIHRGSHTWACVDGQGGQYSWGPPL